MLRKLNNMNFYNTNLIVRLKSDNTYSWVSYEAYKALTMEMSTADYHTHKAVGIYVNADKLGDLKDSGEFIDVYYEGDELFDPSGYAYYSNGDVNFEQWC